MISAVALFSARVARVFGEKYIFTLKKKENIIYKNNINLISIAVYLQDTGIAQQMTLYL